MDESAGEPEKDHLVSHNPLSIVMQIQDKLNETLKMVFVLHVRYDLKYVCPSG